MTWLDEVEGGAPDIVGVYRNIEAGRFITVRREIRKRMGTGSAPSVVPQLAAIVDAISEIVGRLPEPAFRAPGGEGDWNVAEAIGHVAESRSGLSMAGALAAQDRWPEDAPAVVPGIPGTGSATREGLLRRLVVSQKIIERSARSIEGHETDPCPLEHPQVGRLRCGEWLLFAGVHDLMHLEQLHGIEASFAGVPG